MRTRLWLLGPFIPIIVGVILIVPLENLPTWDMDRSSDGRLVAISKLSSSRGRRGKLEVWDLQNGKRILSAKNYEAIGELSFAPNGNTLAVRNLFGKVSIWDLQTGQVSKTINLGTYIVWAFYSRDGEKLICGTSGGTVILYDVQTGEQRTAKARVGTRSPLFATAGNRLVTRFTGRVAGQNNLQISDLDLETGDFRKVRPLTITDGVHAISRDGKRLAVASQSGVPRRPRISIYDLDSLLEIHKWTPRTGIVGMVLSRDGSALATIDAQRQIDVWNVESRKKTATFWHRSHVRFSFSNDGRFLLAVDMDGTAIKLRLADEHLETVFSSNHRWLPIWMCGLVLSFVAWFLVWVRTGITRNRSFRALADVVILHAVVLGASSLRLLHLGSTPDLTRPSGLVFQAVGGSVLAMFLLWFVMGGLRWQFRVAVFIAAIALAWLVTIALWQNDYGQDLYIVVVGMTTIICLVFGILGIRKLGYRLIHKSPNRIDDLASAIEGQFSIKDAMFWIAAAAALFAVGRIAIPISMPLSQVGFHVLLGVCEAATSLTAIWAGLGARRTWPWWIATGVVAIAVGALPSIFVRTDLPWLWYVALQLVRAVFLIVSLSIFRATGYFLARIEA